MGPKVKTLVAIMAYVTLCGYASCDERPFISYDLYTSGGSSITKWVFDPQALGQMTKLGVEPGPLSTPEPIGASTPPASVTVGSATYTVVGSVFRRPSTKIELFTAGTQGDCDGDSPCDVKLHICKGTPNSSDSTRNLAPGDTGQSPEPAPSPPPSKRDYVYPLALLMSDNWAVDSTVASGNGVGLFSGTKWLHFSNATIVDPNNTKGQDNTLQGWGLVNGSNQLVLYLRDVHPDTMPSPEPIDMKDWFCNPHALLSRPHA